MCIAILTPPGKRLTEEQFKACWEANDDGAGLAYSNGKEMVIVKELGSLKRFWTLYNKHRDANPNVPMLVHFRIRTHGNIDLTSTQPIQINKHLAYIHNGTISKLPTHKDFSDTVMFKKLVLEHLPNGFFMRKSYQYLIQEAIGTWNKLIFLDVHHRWKIFNEKEGCWEDDIWFSNRTFKYARSDGHKWKGGSFFNDHKTSTVQHGSSCSVTPQQQALLPASTFPNVARIEAGITRLSERLERRKKMRELADRQAKVTSIVIGNSIGYQNCVNCSEPFKAKELAGHFIIESKDVFACEKCTDDLKSIGVHPANMVYIKGSNTDTNQDNKEGLQKLVTL